MARLSQNATLPGAQRKRTVNSGRTMCSHRNSSTHLALARRQCRRLTSETTGSRTARARRFPGARARSDARSPACACASAPGTPASRPRPPAARSGARHASRRRTACMAGRERVIGRGQVGELGVAAVGRHDLAAQDGRRRRIDRRGDVGVPARPGAEQDVTATGHWSPVTLFRLSVISSAIAAMAMAIAFGRTSSMGSPPMIRCMQSVRARSAAAAAARRAVSTPT